MKRYGMTVFYVCSFGGSGSTALARYLGHFGSRVYHVHSRQPPPRLTEVDVFTEHFTNVPTNADVKVIFVHRDPVRAILSRFESPAHLKNIESPIVSIADVVAAGKDLYGLNEFFFNYLNSKRNYKIYFVKYETMFGHLPQLHQVLGIQGRPLKLERHESKRDRRKEEDALRAIYAPLNAVLNSMPPIYCR